MEFSFSTFTAKDHWKIRLVLSKRITFNFLSTYFKKLFFLLWEKTKWLGWIYCWCKLAQHLLQSMDQCQFLPTVLSRLPQAASSWLQYCRGQTIILLNFTQSNTEQQMSPFMYLILSIESLCLNRMRHATLTLTEPWTSAPCAGLKIQSSQDVYLCLCESVCVHKYTYI